MNEEGQVGEGSPGEETGQKEWTQTQQQPQQRPPQPSQRPQRAQRTPQKGLMEKLTSNSGLSKMIAIGFVILLVGMLLIHASSFITNHDGKDLGKRHDVDDDGENDYNEDQILTPKEKQDDQAFQNTLTYIGRMITDIGIFFIGAFLAIGGISRDDLDTKYRMVMVSLAVLLIIVAWFGFLTAVPVAVPALS